MADSANTYTEEDVLEIIRTKVAEAESLRDLASKVGMSPAYLSDVKLGRRGISEVVAKKFGFERIVMTTVVFRKTEK